MDQFPEIFVLRHGQTEWNLAGRFQGRLNSPLTDLGREHARHQAVILQDVLDGRDDIDARISPQGRVLDTAKIALKGFGFDPVIDDRLCEIGYGEWQGLSFAEMEAGWPERTKDAAIYPFEMEFMSPGGESFDEMYERVLAVLESLTKPTVIVTHGITSRVLRGVWLGGGMDEMAALEGGQGCVYHLKDGQHFKLEMPG